MSNTKDSRARLGEFEIIAKYFAPLASKDGAFGLLDDAARLRAGADEDLVFTIDSLAAGVHFFADDPAAFIAQKALRVNLSDLAAKGATPRAYLLSLALPADWSQSWLSEFSSGLARDQARYGIELYGGDTLKSPGGLVISITAVGSTPRDAMVTRLGGACGDALYVSGTIGDAALGLPVHAANPEIAGWPLSDGQKSYLRDRYLLPSPRVELAPAVRRHANAAMDISDGFLGDLAKLCKASKLGAVVNIDKVPHSAAIRTLIAYSPDLRERALNGGDDYELLCAVPDNRSSGFEADAATAGIPVMQVGRLTKYAAGVSVVDDGGETVSIAGNSFEHF